MQFPQADSNDDNEREKTGNAEFENEVKERLQQVTELVAGFATSPSNLVLVEKKPVREALEELMVKEAALQWIVRVASHSEGPVREKLWDDIDKAVLSLEKIANVYKTYAKMVINYASPSRINLQNGNGGRIAS